MTLQNVVSPTFAIDSGNVNPAYQAFDGNTASNWATSQVSSEGISGVAWVGQNFGSAKDIRQVTIAQLSAATAINSVVVQYSDNGSSWTSQGTHTISKDTAVNTITFSTVGSHQYWRFLANANPGGTERWQVTEITMLAESSASSASPKFQAYNSVNQSLTANTLTVVDFDTAYYDNNANYNESNGRFTPTVAGYYHVDVWVHVEGTVNGQIDLPLYRGVDPYLLVEFASTGKLVGYGMDIYMNGTTDYIEIRIKVPSGSSLSINGPKTQINAHFIGV